MVRSDDARILIRAAVLRAQAEVSPWQLLRKAALAFLLEILPKLLPLILADAEDAGVSLAPDAQALARAARR